MKVFSLNLVSANIWFYQIIYLKLASKLLLLSETKSNHNKSTMSEMFLLFLENFSLGKEKFLFPLLGNLLLWGIIAFFSIRHIKKEKKRELEETTTSSNEGKHLK